MEISSITEIFKEQWDITFKERNTYHYKEDVNYYGLDKSIKILKVYFLLVEDEIIWMD